MVPGTFLSFQDFFLGIDNNVSDFYLTLLALSLKVGQKHCI